MQVGVNPGRENLSRLFSKKEDIGQNFTYCGADCVSVRSVPQFFCTQKEV